MKKADKQKLLSSLEASLANPEDEAAKDGYIDLMTHAVADGPADAEVLSIVIRGISIDHGTCLRDQINKSDNKQVAEIVKAIKSIKSNKKTGRQDLLRFACVLLATAMENHEFANAMWDTIFNLMVLNGNQGKLDCDSSSAHEILEFYLLELAAGAKYPDWSSVNAKAKSASEFIAFMTSFLDTHVVSEGDMEVFPRARDLRHWLNKGRPVMDKKHEIEEWEAKRPARRSQELEDLAKHYKETDKALDELHEENTKLQKEVQQLRSSLVDRESEILQLNATMASLERRSDELSKKLAESQGKLDESVMLNSSLETFREDSESALLKEIASSLRAEYTDFVESENDEMDIVLGEIYREKIKSIFRILERKGIQVK